MRSVTRQSWICIVAAALLALSSSAAQGASEEDALRVKIERRGVSSTHLASVGYHPAARVLEIEFQNGDIYRYLAVPQTIVDGLHQAESKGRYFAQKIRGRYEYRHITRATP